MDWQTQLMTLYLTVRDLYRRHLWVHGQHFAPYADLTFTDEEVMTVYLFGAMDHRGPIKQLYHHARRYWHDWFPHLPSYGGFVQRLNRLADVFPALLEHWSSTDAPATATGVADSFPVILAQQTRRYAAKVAPDLAASGYCPTKKLYYHGLKVHVIGDQQPGGLPRPRYIGVTAANLPDGRALELIAPALEYQNPFADKAYEYLTRVASPPFKVVTPVRKAPGQAHLDSADRLYSAAVSRVRQPIEALFAWVQEHTGIEIASKVRSSRGLLVHVFGRLAAALFLLNQPKS